MICPLIKNKADVCSSLALFSKKEKEGWILSKESSNMVTGKSDLVELCFSFSSFQAVTVKEALSAKGRHLRRSISTPNVQHVRRTSLSAPPAAPQGNN